MKTRKRTQFIMLLITAGLLVSMIISFTPSFGALFGGGHSANGGQADNPTALLINGQSISELEVARARQNPPFQTNFEGEVGEDLDTLLVDNLIQTELIRQASSQEKVSATEVKQAVDDWRESQGVGGRKNDASYISLINRFGYTDASFRDVFREQLRMDKYRNNLTDSVEISSTEVNSFYETNNYRYQTDERILAREIVVDTEGLAKDILKQVENGANFAELATEHSLERADRAGALGAAKDTAEPKPVGRAALSSELANAAFAMQAIGLTDIIEVNGRYHIVNVEQYIPSGPQPLDDAREQVESDALDAKKAGVFEETLANLRSQAEITVPATSTIAYDNSAVAKVNDIEITRAELARAVYTNPQISQALRPDTTQIITSLFKPSILESLVDRELAYQGAQKLGATFFGSKDVIASSALNYISKDATVSEDEISEYYDTNLARYTVPAKAVVNRLNFDNQEAASSFREKMISGEDLIESMEELGGTQVDLGTVNPGDLPSELDTILFKTDAFVELANSSEGISDVLVLSEDIVLEDGLREHITPDEEDVSETNNDETKAASTETNTDSSEVTSQEVFVLLIAERTLELVRPLTEVSAQVEAAVLNQKQQSLQTDWLAELRSSASIETFISTEDLVPTPETPTVTTDDGVFETTPIPEDEEPNHEMGN